MEKYMQADHGTAQRFYLKDCDRYKLEGEITKDNWRTGINTCVTHGIIPASKTIT